MRLYKKKHLDMTKIQYGGYKPRWRLTTTEIYKTQKAELMQCLESFAATQLSQPEHTESIAIDGSCLAHILKPKDPTFQDYAMKTFVHNVNTYAKIHRRTDIVFDVYKENSLKMYTSLVRGKGSRRKVTSQGKMLPVAMAGSAGSRNLGPRPLGTPPTVSLVRQAVNTCHSCKTQVQRDQYINNKKKLESASLGSLAFSNLKKLLNFIIQLDFVSSFLDLVKTLSLFLTLKVSVASDQRNFSKLKLIMTY